MQIGENSARTSTGVSMSCRSRFLPLRDRTRGHSSPGPVTSSRTVLQFAMNRKPRAHSPTQHWRLSCELLMAGKRAGAAECHRARRGARESRPPSRPRISPTTVTGPGRHSPELAPWPTMELAHITLRARGVAVEHHSGCERYSEWIVERCTTRSTSTRLKQVRLVTLEHRVMRPRSERVHFVVLGSVPSSSLDADLVVRSQPPAGRDRVGSSALT